MIRNVTSNGLIEYTYKGYTVGESSVFNRRTWCLSISLKCIHFQTLKEFKTWVNNRIVKLN